jgi:hypothetical protein
MSRARPSSRDPLRQGRALGLPPHVARAGTIALTGGARRGDDQPRATLPAVTRFERGLGHEGARNRSAIAGPRVWPCGGSLVGATDRVIRAETFDGKRLTPHDHTLAQEARIAEDSKARDRSLSNSTRNGSKTSRRSLADTNRYRARTRALRDAARSQHAPLFLETEGNAIMAYVWALAGLAALMLGGLVGGGDRADLMLDLVALPAFGGAIVRRGGGLGATRSASSAPGGSFKRSQACAPATGRERIFL